MDLISNLPICNRPSPTLILPVPYVGYVESHLSFLPICRISSSPCLSRLTSSHLRTSIRSKRREIYISLYWYRNYLFIYHIIISANVTVEDCVIVRSSSGDVDILALTLAHDFAGIQDLIHEVASFITKMTKATSSNVDIDKRRAFIVVNACSGNGYVSSSFRKGKIVVRRAMIKQQNM